MTATERLRAMLDKCGVDHLDGESMTYTNDANFMPAAGGTFDVTLYERTTEQAIEAMLGRGTCEVECFDDGMDEGLDGGMFSYAPPTWYLSCGHEAHGRRPSYCPVCGRKVKEG